MPYIDVCKSAKVSLECQKQRHLVLGMRPNIVVFMSSGVGDPFPADCKCSRSAASDPCQFWCVHGVVSYLLLRLVVHHALIGEVRASVLG